MNYYSCMQSTLYKLIINQICDTKVHILILAILNAIDTATTSIMGFFQKHIGLYQEPWCSMLCICIKEYDHKEKASNKILYKINTIYMVNLLLE